MKMIMAALLLLTGATAMAQRDNNLRGERRGMPGMGDMVVDTAIINQMNLEEKMHKEILMLQATKSEEMKAEMQKRREERKGNRQRFSDEERKEMMEKSKAATQAYRNELRKIMGDDLYITYLEKKLDARPMMGRARGGQGMREGGMPQRGGRGGGFGGNGGFGGGGFGGGDFGGGDF